MSYTAQSEHRAILLVNEARSLSKVELWRLANDELAAIHVKRFLEPRQCHHLCSRVLTVDGLVEHREVPGLLLLGASFYSASRDPIARADYFRNSHVIIEELQRLAEPFESPLQQIETYLEAAWAAGVERQATEDGAMRPAIIRVYREGVGIPIHNDVLSDEVPDSASARCVTSQLGLNLFLAVPDSGGDLELYLRSYSREEYHRLCIPGTDDIDPNVVGAPAVTIKPGLGDLILILSRNIHGVSPVRGRSVRMTLSTFIGMRSLDEPLTMWA